MKIPGPGTHAIGPMEDWLHEQYGNPYPIESALFEFENGLNGEAVIVPEF